ncbi:MAG: heat-inducible transcriptional repressor HrcA [Acidobacteriia bacterium]|nr:heat-inducible transcriptional repressor HrcA [Terriglobia bacterium]
MWSDIQLDRRKGGILAAVVRLFVVTGVPVGSKAVAEHLSEPLSSATIRNVMVELEQEGYLVQPHVSAGRIPTDKAYRFYVDRIVEAIRLPADTRRFIEESLAGEGDVPEKLMVRTSLLLSQVSHNVGVVLGPPLEEKVLEHIKFVRLPDRRVLAVIVSKPDLIENKVIHLEDDFSQEELDRAAEFLNGEFHGWSLRAIRLDIFKRLERMKAFCDRMVSTVATLFRWGALGGREPGPLYVEGTDSILGQPDFGAPDVIKGLLKAFEEKVKLVKILSACLETPGPGVWTLIGRENPASEMRQCAVIVAPFRYRDRVLGALGVVGPMRMEYDRAITTVDYVAHLCSRLLSAN